MRRVLQRPRPYPKWTAAIEMFLERPNKPQVFCVSATHGVWSSAMCTKAAKNTLWDQRRLQTSQTKLPGQSQLATSLPADRNTFLNTRNSETGSWHCEFDIHCLAAWGWSWQSQKASKIKEYAFLPFNCWRLLTPFVTSHPPRACPGVPQYLRSGGANWAD